MDDRLMMVRRPRVSGTAVALALALATSTFHGGGGVLADSSTTIVQTKNYIDTITGYTDLSTCAENVLSTVVRGEYSGCADDYAITSYTCFCTDSSSYMSAVISKDVMSSCPASVASVQASSALGIFDAYCELGVDVGMATQTAQVEAGSSATSTATPAAVATVTVTPTSAASSGSSSSGSLSSTSTAVIIGVLVSVFGIGMFLAAWFIWRKYKAAKAIRAWPDEVHGGESGGGGAPRSMLPAGKFAEVPGQDKSWEMSAAVRPAEMLTTEWPVEAVGDQPPVVEMPAGVVARRGDHVGVNERQAGSVVGERFPR